MGSMFSSKPKTPAVDPELARLRQENAKRASDEKARLAKLAQEEKDAVQRRLRGSRSLFVAGQTGFDEDDNVQDTLGTA
jgi:hypothetical protein|tara:strand:+ start:475 stop:711 length:237 start_codon:yes stop_codon:yes gene_type:complete